MAQYDNKSRVDTIDITPSTNFLITTQATGYLVWEAVNDIIDNMDDALAQNFQVELVKGKPFPKVILTDDGHGMDKKTLSNCLILGVGEKEIDNYKGRIDDRASGRYGTGLNTSIATFQGKATIFSRGKGESKLYKLTYDVTEIAKSGSWSIPIEEADTGETIWFDSSVNGNDTGTVIVIEDITLFRNEDYENTRQKLIKTMARVFRKHILAGKKFTFKGEQKAVKLEPFDPMFHDVPIIEGGITYKAELMQDITITGIEYRCRKTGKKKKDGTIRVKCYKLPRAEESIAKKYGINMVNSGIYIMRHDREIVAGQTFEIYNKNSTLNRYRVEVYFDTELDEVMGLTYLKNSVDPNQQILDKLSDLIQPDIKEVRSWWQKGAGKVTNTKTQRPHVTKYERHAEDKSKKLGPVTETLDKKKPTLKGTVIDSNNDASMSSTKIDYDFSGNPMGKVFEGRVKLNGKQTTEIIVNGNHKLNTDYLNDGESSDKKYSQDSVMSLCYSWMISLTHAKEYNRPHGTTDEIQEYYDMWDNIEQKMATQMRTLLDGQPK